MRITVNNKSSCAAASFCHHVTSHAGVVGGVGESGLFDDQIMIDGDQEVGVLRWIYDILVFQPVHLERDTQIHINQNFAMMKEIFKQRDDNGCKLKK